MGTLRSLVVATVVFAGVLTSPGVGYAHAGELAAGFGTGGRVTTDFAGGFDEVNALVRHRDGLVAAGSAGRPVGTGFTTDFGLARYRRDGALDASFGIGGKVATDFLGGEDRATGVVALPDGRLVAAGTAFPPSGSNPDFALARYHADGTLDDTFGTGGKVTTDFGAHEEATALVRQPDGRLVVAGFTIVSPGTVRFALARYLPDGQLDATFGTGGQVTTAINSVARAYALVLQPDGRLVAAGYTTAASDDFALVRYLPDGSLDPTFGTGGVVVTDFGATLDQAFALVQQPDGRLVAAGHTVPGFDFALARYRPDGTLDPTFGTGGKVTTDFGGLAQANALALPDGRIVAAGFADTGQGFDFALAGYQPDGTLDPTFGSGGKVTTDFNGSVDRANALLVLPGHRLVAGGAAFTGYFSDFGLAAYRTGR